MSATIIFATSVFFLTMSFSAKQTMMLDDLTIALPHQKSLNDIKNFLDDRGFDYDTLMLPGSIGKTYNFVSAHTYRVQSSTGDRLEISDLIALRMDTESKIGKVTLMTPSYEYYEEFVAELSEKHFKAKEHTDKSKPLSYTSEQVPGVAVSLATTQAVKDGKVYNRYSISVNY